MESETRGGKENMHVVQVPTSPSFLKPKPIKLKKRSKKPDISVPLKDIDTNLNKQKLGFLIKSPKIPVNPFRRAVNKRKRDPESLDEDSSSLLWKRTNIILEDTHNEINFPSPVVPSLLDENALPAFSLPLSQPTVLEKEKVKSKSIPVDWSLKTKIRFTSAISFPSRGSFRTFEEVNGTVGFVRCLHSNDSVNKLSDIHSSHGAKFFQGCLVWMHPYLPWLNLFPRTDEKFIKQSSPVVPLDSSVLETLHSKWCDSFRSLYQLVRLFQCPYFYMCAPTFTVLFRCAGTASIPVIHALISPTTKGFRKALKKEGIEFTMPMCQNKDSESFDEPDENCNEYGINEYNDRGEENENEIEDEEPESWLESLGLSQDNFPSLNRRKRRDEQSKKIDHAPQSLVYIEDSETQALVNFLLNSNLCTSKIGPLAGIPPTLLAPTAFLGGTLQPLKIHHGTVRNNNKEYESVEISGPLLPNTVHSLCSLFSVTQDGDFSSILTSHSPTLAFSMFTPQSPMLPCIFAKNNMADCGLPEDFVQQMCAKPNEEVLNEINANNGLFTWK